MTKLATLRSGLSALRRWRQSVRWGSALAAVAVALLWALAAIFAIDFGFERLGMHTDALQRSILVLLGAGAVAWAVYRYATPLVSVHETEMEMALLVERQQKIDSDLVAALEFESPEAATWGSPQLESAVIDYVAEWGRGVDVFEGFSRRDLARRAGTLAVTAVVLAGAALLYPAHAAVFFNRLFLGSMHYPSATVIESIVVTGAGLRHEMGAHPHHEEPIKSPYGQEVQFEVRCSGSIPAAGRVQLAGAGTSTSIELERHAGEAGSRVVSFRGKLPRLLESVRYQVLVGDAWTDPAHLNVVPLPVVQTQVRVIPPAYARGTELETESDLSSLQRAVLEGSEVRLEIIRPSKPLAQAVVSVLGMDEPVNIPLVKASDDVWRLPNAETPFRRVTEPIRFEIQVTDADGLKLESPLRGFIRLKADRRPRIAAGLVSRVVLPTAEPVIELRLIDDYGIASVTLQAQIARVGGTIEEVAIPVESVDAVESVPGEGLAGPVGFPLPIERLPLSARYRLVLSPLQLVKGDQLRLTFEAIDNRGDLPGETSQSEPLVLDISDESGVVAAIAEADERSEQRLTDIIKRQLGIGEQK